MNGQLARIDSQVEHFLCRRASSGKLESAAPELRPANAEEAYAILSGVARRLAERGGQQVGYKIGCTSAKAQAVMGTGGPIWGPLFAEAQAANLQAGLARTSGRPGLECEIAIVLSEDIAEPGLSDAAVLARIDNCSAACEIVDNRYGDPASAGAPTLIADGFLHAAYVLAPRCEAWRTSDLATLRGRIEIDGKPVVDAGSDTVLGSPLRALRWLAEDLLRHRLRLRAGDLVLTGSIGTAAWLDAHPSAVAVTVESLGSLTLP